jgi:hypothetical protein
MAEQTIEEGVHEEEGYFFSETLLDELSGHQGKCVAVTRTELLEVGENVGEVLKAVREKGIEAPIILPPESVRYLLDLQTA